MTLTQEPAPSGRLLLFFLNKKFIKKLLTFPNRYFIIDINITIQHMQLLPEPDRVRGMTAVHTSFCEIKLILEELTYGKIYTSP